MLNQKLYIPKINKILMGNSRRLHQHKQRGMTKRSRTGKKPMKPEQKEARKKMAAAHREAALAANAAKKKISKKE